MRDFQPEKSPGDSSGGNGRSSGSEESMSSRGANDQATRISRIIDEVVERRHRGEQISNLEVMAAHPDLMPSLGEELAGLDAIHRVVVIAGKNSPVDLGDDRRSEISPADSENTGAQIDDNRVRELRIQGYIIQREISSGGQATVFQAVRERTGRRVAVKVFHGGPFVGSRGRKRFERESEILARLQHPNIVGIIDRGRTEDGSFFLVMDFVEGTNLDDYIKSLAKDAGAVIRIFIKVARAVDEAHKQDVIHRDLKPMNILVDHRGDPHILDFGMARLVDDFEVGEKGAHQVTLTRTGQVLGSLPWSSPEQATGQHDAVDARTDVYALGVMLFHAFAGAFPYPVACNPRTAMLHITSTPAPVLAPLARRNGINIPKGLEGVIQKALAKSADDRYSSALALASDLEACLEGKPPVIPKRSSHRRLLILLSAAAALIFGMSFHFFRHTPHPPSFVDPENIRFVRISPGAASPVAFGEASAVIIRIDHVYYLSETDITQDQYRLVVGYYPRQKVYDDSSPIQNVTQAQAIEFCRILSNRDGRVYRLPTAAEWKYALYSGLVEPVTSKNLISRAWYAENSDRRSRPVAQKLADGWGLYDMLGNVRQWCSNPNTTGTLAPVEGADYLTAAPDCLDPAKLEIMYPAITAKPTIGFRIACDSAEKQ